MSAFTSLGGGFGRGGGLARHTDLALAALVVAVIVMMALPLPAWSLDVLVAVNISLAVVLLLVALFIPGPLAFSTFPAVLLITTLFRISLNVATTRQILLHAHAGDIIAAFGRMVVGGSLIVGIVVFLIITIVQFIVIAKGAERVAEVSARFTLDALPGKQMSIDADVRAGLISQSEAVLKRQELIRESQFYGSMDGAMKFVKGDAIAGIVIVLVNLLGGIAIGALVMDLSVGAAVQKFSILSIGDGLVTQIPALFVSIAAGIAITRSSNDNAANLGDQIGRQLGSQPRALWLAALVMLLFAFVPGFPTLTFIVLALSLGLMSLWLEKRAREDGVQQSANQLFSAAREGESAAVQWSNQPLASLAPSAFRLELHPDLATRVGASRLDAALATQRQTLRERFGIPFPGLTVQLLDTLKPDEFAVSVQDLRDVSARLPAGGVWLQKPRVVSEQIRAAMEASQALEGASTPLLLGAGQWVAAEQTSALAEAGLQTLDEAEVIAKLVLAVMQKNPASTLGMQEVKGLLKQMEPRFGDLVREAQTVLTLPRLSGLMVALARDRVPLVDLQSLLQAVVNNASMVSTDLVAFYETVRLAMAKGIVASVLPTDAQVLPVLALHADFESHLRTAQVVSGDGPNLAMPAAAAETALQALRKALDAASTHDVRTLLLPNDIRRSVSRLFRAGLPQLAFVSVDELQATDLKAQVVGTAVLS
jgi:type III secretion protein V